MAFILASADRLSGVTEFGETVPGRNGDRTLHGGVIPDVSGDRGACVVLYPRPTQEWTVGTHRETNLNPVDRE